MKNVNKILTVVVLCAAMFASEERTSTLGGAQFWPGDESNIANFPAQANNHSFVQIDGVGTAAAIEDDPDTAEDETAAACEDCGNASILFQKDGTTWGFNYGSDDWVNMTWGDGNQGVSFGLANYSNNLTGDALMEKAGYSLGYGNTFGFGELGVRYTDLDDGSDATLDVYMKRDSGWFIFDNTYIAATNLTGDMNLRADFFSHMDAGGADVVYGWGIDMSMAEVGYMHQTATIGVEANMTDWATLRAGYTWTHVLSADDTPQVGTAATDLVGTAQVGTALVGTAMVGTAMVGTDAVVDDPNTADVDETAAASDDYAAAMIASTGVSDGAFSWGLGFNWGGLTADFKVSSSLLLDPIGTVTGNNDDAGGLTDTGITLTYSF